LETSGADHDDAITRTGWSDDTTASCLLDLYRSATAQHLQRREGRLESPKEHGLVLHPTADPFGEATTSRRVAQMLGARHETLEDAATGVRCRRPTPRPS
jgi:hypothetical protein